MIKTVVDVDVYCLGDAIVLAGDNDPNRVG